MFFPAPSDWWVWEEVCSNPWCGGSPSCLPHKPWSHQVRSLALASSFSLLFCFWFLNCKISFKSFHIFIQHSLPFCELLIVGFPSKWTIRWCSLVPLPSQPLLVTVIFFAFVLSFPISYLLAKSEAMSLVLGRAHSIPGVIKIRGMSAITIDKACKSIHMF